MEITLRELIALFDAIRGEATLLEIKCNNLPDTAPEQKDLSDIRNLLSVMNSWMLLLTTDERFVIKKHIVEGIEWARIVKDHCAPYGPEYEKTDRTLRKYQRKALTKIEKAIDRHGFPAVPNRVIRLKDEIDALQGHGYAL